MNENNVRFVNDLIDKEFKTLNIKLKNLIETTLNELKTHIEFELNRQMLIERSILKK